jgi:hypothetical protein
MMDNDSNEIILEALYKMLDSIINWKPDPEEYGMQFGPDLRKALEVVQVILKINPDAKIPMNERFKNYIHGMGLEEFYKDILPVGKIKMGFGKYKNCEVEMVASRAPRYIVWAHENAKCMSREVKEEVSKYYKQCLQNSIVSTHVDTDDFDWTGGSFDEDQSWGFK